MAPGKGGMPAPNNPATGPAPERVVEPVRGAWSIQTTKTTVITELDPKLFDFSKLGDSVQVYRIDFRQQWLDPELASLMRSTRHLEFGVHRRLSLQNKDVTKEELDAIVRTLKMAYGFDIKVETHPPYWVVRSQFGPDGLFLDAPITRIVTVAGVPLLFKGNDEKIPDALVLGERGQKGDAKVASQSGSIDAINGSDIIPLSQFRDIVKYFTSNVGSVFEIIYCGNWSIVVEKGKDSAVLPEKLNGVYCGYRFQSRIPKTRTSTNSIPDHSNYLRQYPSLLRPGCMMAMEKLGNPDKSYENVTSGVLVRNALGHPFITVAASDFTPGGMIYHPAPEKGVQIGQIVKNIPGTNIYIVKLERGIAYGNQTFASPLARAGQMIKKVATSDISIWDKVSMNSP